MQSSKFAQELHDLVDAAQTIADLVPLLNSINLHRVKETIHEEINQLNTNELRTAHLKSMPMDEILRDDVTQHILSFLNCYTTKSINKQFKAYADQNEEIYLKQIYQDDQ